MRLLGAARVAQLRVAAYTYPEVGATVSPDALPRGYSHIVRSWPLTIPYAEARARLFGWQMHSGAGLRVSASGPVGPDAVAELFVRIGPIPVRPVCRVVWVVDDPGRCGFAYGTLPGHPECGEEAFVITGSGGTVTLRIVAFSRPTSALARLGGPITRRLQDHFTQRYAAALGA